MLSIEIRLLTGRYAAASVTDSEAAEWPPHPARVYSALTAALCTEPEPEPDEVQALEWLATLGPPEIYASEADERRLGSVYVPANDQSALADIDPQLRRLTEAEGALSVAEGAARQKAQQSVDKAQAALLSRSEASASPGSRGNSSQAAEVLNRRLNPQPRRFPSSVPEKDTVHIVWPVSPEADAVRSLDRLAARVASLGHSASLVSLRVIEGGSLIAGEAEEWNRWTPSESGDTFLRVAGPGQLQRLQEAHLRHRQVEQRLLPAEQVRYRKVGDTDVSREQVPTGLFSSRGEDWIVFEVVPEARGERRVLLDLSLAERVTRALRGTLLRHMDHEVSPETLSGHDATGGPATLPHVAYIPLGDVRRPGSGGHGYASGSILGIAVVPPRDFGSQARHLLLKAIHDAEQEGWGAGGGIPEIPSLRLTLGRHGVVHVRRVVGTSSLMTLQPKRWIGPARRWTSATAPALGRNPGNLRSRNPEELAVALAQAEQTLLQDCERIGLPRPDAMWLHLRALLDGAPAANRFMPYPSTGQGPKRVCVHVELLFSEPVMGPILLGAGRFFGVGMFAPISDKAEDR